MEKETKNVSCNIFLEQLELINQLPLEERGKVLYLSILNAFNNQVDYQLENHLDDTYISISKSISLSLSILSNTVLHLLNKTIVCKKYNKNWGGKRESSGRPKLYAINTECPSKENIEAYCKTIAKKINIDDFMEYYNASNWKDKNELPINWKQKVISWSMRNQQKEVVTEEKSPYVHYRRELVNEQ